MDLSKIQQLYDENIEKFGLDSRSVGWSTHDSQYLRFKKLLNMIEYPGHAFTLNELGCGYGELFNYCIENGLNLEKYYGYDISQKMIEKAGEYIHSNNAEFIQSADIRTQADYTITSGIFNVKFDHDQDSWEDYIKKTLKQMFDNSRKGISFNLLTKYVDYHVENLYYADPVYFFDFCKTYLTKKVNLLHDYELYEWTITAVR